MAWKLQCKTVVPLLGPYDNDRFRIEVLPYLMYRGRDKMAAFFADSILKWSCMIILIQASLKLASNGTMKRKSSFMLIVARCRTGDKPSFETMMAKFPDAYKRHEALMY